jgi:hypothetical protein
MEEPLLTVRDLSVEFKNDTGETELLRNYEFNISQGIVQRVSRFFDALALIDERGEAPPARGEDGKYATDSARGGVMGFGRKSNVCNQERHPARRVAREQQDVALEAKVAAAAALKVTEQDAKVAALEAEVAVLRAAEQVAKIAALEAEVAKLQALAAPSLQLYALSHPRHTFGTLRTLRALRTLRTLRSLHLRTTPCNLCRLHPCTTCVLRRSWLRGGGGLKLFEPRSLASPGLFASHAALLPRLTRGWWGTG